jgi:hypothetical protein
MAILFKEEQRFSRNLLWVVALFLPVLMLVILIYQLYSGKLVGTYPMSNRSLSILSIIYFIPALLAFRFIKLTTVISEDKIQYGWNIPTSELNEIGISEIKACGLVEYSFVGYGYRISRLYGTVYNVSGNRGLQIIKHNGEKVLIGTGKPEEIKQVIERLIFKKQGQAT